MDNREGDTWVGDLTAEAVERGAIATKTLPDGRVIDVTPLGWGYALVGIIWVEDSSFGLYSDVWQYQSRETAIEAMTAWDGTGEPSNWYRHPATGRRRPGGDPTKEYVRQ